MATKTTEGTLEEEGGEGGQEESGLGTSVALAWGCIRSVSYTHLTLPTNREV